MKNLTKTLLGACMAGTALLQAGIPAVYAQDLNASAQVTNGSASLGDGEGSITVNGGKQDLENKKFNIYPVFQVKSYSKSGTPSYDYQFDDSTKASVQEVIMELVNEKTPGTYTAASEVTIAKAVDFVSGLSAQGKTSQVRTFAEKLRTKFVTNNVTPTVVTISSAASGNSFTLSGLPYGYYLIDEIYTSTGEKAGAASTVMIDTIAPNASVDLKADYPSLVDKKVEQSTGSGTYVEVTDYENGSTVSFQYTVDLPDLSAYSTYMLIFHDQMDAGLDFINDSVVIKIKDSTTEKSLTTGQYSLSQASGTDTFTITIEDLISLMNTLSLNWAGAKIEVTYNAKVNLAGENLITDTDLINKVRLQYSNDPDADKKSGVDEPFGYTDWDAAAVWTYTLDSEKVNTKNEKLSGAKFELYRTNTGGTLSDRVNFTLKDGVYVFDSNGGVSEITSAESTGKFKIAGLDSGTYYLKETAAPEGYATLSEPVEITITAQFDQEKDALEAGSLKELKMTASYKDTSGTDRTTDLIVSDGTGSLSVVNLGVDELPSTGASTMLWIAGAGVATLAGAFFLGKKKESAE